MPIPDIHFQRLPLLLVRLILGREFYSMFRWFNEAGSKADIAGLRRTYPEVHLQNLEEWLRNDDLPIGDQESLGVSFFEIEPLK